MLELVGEDLVAMQLNIEHLEFLAPFFKGKEGVAGTAQRQRFQSSEALLDEHFREFSDSQHICRPSITAAIKKLMNRPATIVETGSAAWGTKSSLLFDSYVNSFGGSFSSVDIRVEPMWTLSRQCSPNSRLFCDDSVSFLSKRFSDQRIDLCYLDSFDLDLSNPMPAAIHGFQEFFCVLPSLRKHGGLLLVDDTPRDPSYFAQQGEIQWNNCIERFGVPPGKGSLIVDYLARHSFAALVYHNYQVLYEFVPGT